MDAKPDSIVVIDAPHALGIPKSPETPFSTLLSGQLGSGITLPFQYSFKAYVGTLVFETIRVADIPVVSELMKLGRLCTLTSLSMTLLPTSKVLIEPFTFEGVFTPNYIVPTQDEIWKTIGFSRFIVGGACQSTNYDIIADFQFMNPTIKSPVTVNDDPRVSFMCSRSMVQATKTYNTEILSLALVQVRGSIHIAFPGLY